MTIKIKYLASAGLLLFGAVLLSGAGAEFRLLPPQRDTGLTAAISDVTWEKAYRKGGLTVTPGAAAASFGRFDFYCRVSAAGRSSLVILVPRGEGELPPRTEKLFIRVNDHQSVTLLQQWFPLANSGRPVQLKAVVTVNSQQLFAVLPKPDLPAGGGRVAGISTIRWSKVQIKGRDRYLAGRIRTRSGRLAVFWKVGTGQILQLIWAESAAPVGRPDREAPLYLLEDAAANTTTLYQERQPPPGRPGTADLRPVAVVKTYQLLKGLVQVQRNL
jgi:hypothetical protein